jgi:hypothetical protein
VDTQTHISHLYRLGEQRNARLTRPIIVNSAKRDRHASLWLSRVGCACAQADFCLPFVSMCRMVWPADMDIAVLTQFMLTNSLLSTKSALSAMFGNINLTTGALPECGPSLSQLSIMSPATFTPASCWACPAGDTYRVQNTSSEAKTRGWRTPVHQVVAYIEAKFNGSWLMSATGLRDRARKGRAITSRGERDAASRACHSCVANQRNG